jgi:hypothetical protein
MPNNLFTLTEKTIYFFFTFLCLFLPQQVLAQARDSFDKEELVAANSIFSGDLEAVVERGCIRVLIPYNQSFFIGGTDYWSIIEPWLVACRRGPGDLCFTRNRPLRPG